MRDQCLRSLALALVVVLAVACSGSAGPDTSSPSTGAPGDLVPVKIAVFEDLSIQDSAQLVRPASFGLQLALTEGAATVPVAVQLVTQDVSGDPVHAAELARLVADDPTYVAAVIAPFWAQTRAVGDILDAAHVPTLSLSALAPDIPSYGWSSWRRLVPTQPRQADSLGALVSGSANSETGVCLVRDASPYSVALTGLLRSRLRRLVTKVITLSPDLGPADASGQAVADIDAAGCRTLVWTGFAASGAQLRTSLTTAGLSGVVMYGADALKDESFLTAAGAAGEGTIVTCPCADLSTATDPAAQRFVHDYQSQFGASPAVYSAEGWDLGAILLAAFRTGATGRGALAAALSAVREMRGLAGLYRWTDLGELTPEMAQVHTSIDRGQRWTPLVAAPAVGPEALPLHTEGLLTAAACRSGLPFNAQERGRPTGFDVDLAEAISKSLGVQLGWQPVGCDRAKAELASGRLDMLLTARDALPQGTATSRIVLSIRTAVVTRRGDAAAAVPGILGPTDLVGVVSGPVTTPWVQQVMGGPGAKVRRYARAADAYDALARGDVRAVVDTEFGAWAGIERRPRLSVAASFDSGAHDVLVTSGSGTELLGAVDGAAGHLLQTGRYALLWTKWFPGTIVPDEVGH